MIRIAVCALVWLVLVSPIRSRAEDLLVANKSADELVRVDLTSGDVLWRREMSSYAGLDARGGALYLSDDESRVWALDSNTSASIWRQDKLVRRALTQPAAVDDAVLVGDFRDTLAALETWDTEGLERAMREFVKTRELKLGAIIHAVRVAVSGKGVGFGMFETLEILGREQTLGRIDRALERLRGQEQATF